MCSPHLTTIDQRIEETIRAVQEVVMDELAKYSTKPVVRVIPARLVRRGSTGPVRS